MGTFLRSLSFAPAPDSEAQKRRRSTVAISIRKSSKRSKLKRLQARVWNLLERPDGGMLSRVFHACWSILILFSCCLAITSETGSSGESGSNGLKDLPGTRGKVLSTFELACAAVFIIEFVVKVMVVGPHMHAFLRNPYTLVDVIVVVQCLTIAFDLRGSRWVRLFNLLAPILRLLKVVRLSPKWRLLVISLGRCIEPLAIPMYLLLLMVMFSGSFLYWAEKEFPDCVPDVAGLENPCPSGRNPAFLSIPHAMWFVIVTVTTTGYGDITPRSDLGRVYASMLIIAGACYMAMPLAIVGGQFQNVWQERAVLLVLDKLADSMGGKIDMDQVTLMFEDVTEGTEQGEITFEMFQNIVEGLEVGLEEDDTQKLFNAIDADKSGVINLEEFGLFVMQRR